MCREFSGCFRDEPFLHFFSSSKELVFKTKDTRSLPLMGCRWTPLCYSWIVGWHSGFAAAALCALQLNCLVIGTVSSFAVSGSKAFRLHVSLGENILVAFS